MTKARKDFKDDLKWKVEDLYSSEEDFELDYQYVKKHLKEYEKYQGHLLDKENILYEALNFDHELAKIMEKIYVYAHINNDSDTTDTKYQTMFGRAYKLYEEYNEVTSFITPEILKDAFWQLYSEKDINKIRSVEITDLAGYNRGVF